MKNVSEIKNCYGCGVCAASCSRRIIDLRYNSDGFLIPYIDKIEECNGCGLCVKVCSFVNSTHFIEPKNSYVAWSNDEHVRAQSTSGGVSIELAKLYVSNGFSFCGVRYDLKKQRAEHYVAQTEPELCFSLGSKYLQSYTVEAFQSINRNEKNLVVGTPCQMASFRRYIKLFHCEENFLLVDFFCHGVPSMLMWKKYLKEKTKNMGELKNVSWRNKSKGWRNGYCITIDCSKKTLKSWKGKDAFFTLFLGNACLNAACYDSCKYKYNQSSADIRLGDCWSNKYKDNFEGVSAAIAFTERGEDVLRNASLHLEEFTFDQVAKGQMKSNSRRPWYYDITMRMIRGNYPLSFLCTIIRISNRCKACFKRIKELIKV